MSFTRCGLNFIEVERTDFPKLREQRNTNWSGYRDPFPVMTLNNQEDWYKSLGHDNLAFMVLDENFRIGLLRISQFDHQNRSANIIGVDVFPGYTGKGYSTKIVRAAAEWLIHDLGYHRVKGECTESNIGMRKGLERAGFQLEGRMRGYIWRSGKWNDFLQYSILAEELWPEETPQPAEGL